MPVKSYLPPFGKVLITTILLGLIGFGGLFFLFINTEPTLGPRWLFFFFLTIAGGGAALPIVYMIQRRTAKQYVPAKVILREAILFGIFLDLLAWMQIGRIITNLIVIILASGLVLLEVFLRMAEKATFKADENNDE
jgi:hypothetical protein